LWALRVAVLAQGPWILVMNEKNLKLLLNSPRKRKLALNKKLII
jgi:hypothetical protein